ncbi:MAG: TetR/AcrR family transcriptional regulator [Myxococcota bacterium]
MARPGRHSEGARTRERVLQAAAKLIGAQGYAATSISQISKESGAQPASIYWAFGNKEGLLASVMENAASEFFDAVSVVPASRENPWNTLTSLSEFFEGGPEFLRLLLVLSLERRSGDPAVLEAARRVRTTAADSLAAGYAAVLDTRDGETRDRIAQELARFTLMLFDGAFVASQIEPDTTDLKRAFALIATGVRATGEHLLAESERDSKAKGALR